MSFSDRSLPDVLMSGKLIFFYLEDRPFPSILPLPHLFAFPSTQSDVVLNQPHDMVDMESPQSNLEKPKGKRGRPRLQRSVQTQTERRRAQVRDAQRTYRLKKESATHNLQRRVSVLETALSGMETLFHELYEAGVEIAVRESNNDLMQIFARAGITFENLVALTGSLSPQEVEAPTATRSGRSTPLQKQDTQVTREAEPLVEHTQHLSSDDSSISPLVNPKNGFLDGFPQDLIPSDSSEEGKGNPLNMTPMLKYLDKLSDEQQQQQQLRQQQQQHLQQVQQQQQNIQHQLSSETMPFLRQNNHKRDEFTILDGLWKSSMTPPHISIFDSPPPGALSILPAANCPIPEQFIETPRQFPLNRAELQATALRVLEKCESPEHVISLSSGIAERMVRKCVLSLVKYYSENQFKELQIVFHNEFFNFEFKIIHQFLESALSKTSYKTWPWVGTEDDSLFPGYSSPSSVEKIFHAAQNAGTRFDEEKFLKLVCTNSLNLGHLPRVAYSDIQSAIVLSTEF